MKLSEKVSKLIKEGYPQKQAVAIAYSMLENHRQMGGPAGEEQGPQPIQAEVGEEIFIGPNIVSSHAKKKHSQMKDDQVTDYLPEGSYVASNDKNMTISKNEAEGFVIGMSPTTYGETDEIPIKLGKEITLADLYGKKSKLRPSEIARLLKKKFDVTDRENDAFSEFSNQENFSSRVPYIQAIIEANEAAKVLNEDIPEELPIMKKGGKVKKYQSGDPVTGLMRDPKFRAWYQNMSPDSRAMYIANNMLTPEGKKRWEAFSQVFPLQPPPQHPFAQDTSIISDPDSLWQNTSVNDGWNYDLQTLPQDSTLADGSSRNFPVPDRVGTWEDMFPIPDQVGTFELPEVVVTAPRPERRGTSWSPRVPGDILRTDPIPPTTFPPLPRVPREPTFPNRQFPSQFPSGTTPQITYDEIKKGLFSTGTGAPQEQQASPMSSMMQEYLDQLRGDLAGRKQQGSGLLAQLASMTAGTGFGLAAQLLQNPRAPRLEERNPYLNRMTGIPRSYFDYTNNQLALNANRAQRMYGDNTQQFSRFSSAMTPVFSNILDKQSQFAAQMLPQNAQMLNQKQAALSQDWRGVTSQNANWANEERTFNNQRLASIGDLGMNYGNNLGQALEAHRRYKAQQAAQEFANNQFLANMMMQGRMFDYYTDRARTS